MTIILFVVLHEDSGRFRRGDVGRNDQVNADQNDGCLASYYLSCDS